MSATEHDVRDMCHDCGAWFWVSDGHSCAPADFLTDAVMAAAFPTHGLMVPEHADATARRAGEAYRARIAEENTYYAGLFGLVLTGRAAA